MKMKRIISLAIALLLVCGMPVSAFADGQDNNGHIEDNDQSWSSNFGTIKNNNGSVGDNKNEVENNYGYVEQNSGTVDTNMNNGTVNTNINGGKVHTNNGTVNSNLGTVETNNSTGTVTNAGNDAFHGKVYENYGNVNNNGDVVTNYSGGKVSNQTQGTVGTNNEGGEVTTNSGTVTTNLGTVIANEKGGKVVNNGTADNNADAKVGINNGEVSYNSGTVGTNNGIVTANYDKAVVEINADKGIVSDNGGTVKTNDGTVSNNIKHGTVETNNGSVDDNKGTVDINNGTVQHNYGTVETNNITGTVTNYGGTVEKNYGTVIDRTSNDKTAYGVQIDDDGTVALEQKEKGGILDLSKLFSKAGYELTGYTQAYQSGENGLTQSSVDVEGTDYSADCPNILTLIWRALFSEDEGGYFGPGCYISVNGRQYILVEIKDGDYYLASCDEYTKEQLSNLDALLASLLTEEQLDCVTGAAGILNAELAETFFGGGSHIVFPCSKYLIFH